MTTIAEISDEPKYTIKAVSVQTGILPVTLRAWERRHDLLSPQRGENRYRLYSERDVAILIWIKGRVDNGVSIRSAAAEFRSMLRSGSWPDTSSAAPGLEPVIKSSTPPAQFVARLYQAFIKHDEATIGDVLREVLSGFELVDAYQEVLIPALVELGDAWYNGKIRVTTEHFVSALIRGKLLNLFQTMPLHRSGPYVMVGCAPYEEHEIGSLMLATMLRNAGLRVEYLGPDIPLDDLVDYASYEHPNMVILSASLDSSAKALQKTQEKLSRLRPAVLFGYGGAAFTINPTLIQSTPGIYLGKTLEESFEKASSLLKKGLHK